MGPESPSVSTGCKVAHFSLMHSVCEDCNRFALDSGVYKKICTTKYRLLSESDPLVGSTRAQYLHPNNAKRGMNHNIICTCKFNIYKNHKKKMDKSFCALWILNSFFFFLGGMSKNVMAFSYNVHNKTLGNTTTGSAPHILKCSARWI